MNSQNLLGEKISDKKFCVIIDAYPQTTEEQEILLVNLKNFQQNGIDVLLTSHHPCTPEIIENTTYFLFEKKNNHHFLDSDVLNYNLEGVKNPIYMKYMTIGDDMFRDYLVVTGWSVAIVSQFVNATKFIHSKGYEFAFYFVGDFSCPVDIKNKIQNIFSSLGEHKNYFIRHNPNFASWFCPFLFGFTLDENLMSKIPNLDFSVNLNYQTVFPNCALEDVILKLFNEDNNLVVEHSELDNFFGTGNWNMIRSIIKPGPSSLHSTTVSSLFWKEDLTEACLLLSVDPECIAESVHFSIEISSEKSGVVFRAEKKLGRSGWYKEKIEDLLEQDEKIILTKKVQSLEDETCFFFDSIEIRKDLLPHYALLKNYYKV